MWLYYYLLDYHYSYLLLLFVVRQRIPRLLTKFVDQLNWTINSETNLANRLGRTSQKERSCVNIDASLNVMDGCNFQGGVSQ